MTAILKLMKEVGHEIGILLVYVLVIFIPAALIVGSCNALIERQINIHKFQ